MTEAARPRLTAGIGQPVRSVVSPLGLLIRVMLVVALGTATALATFTGVATTAAGSASYVYDGRTLARVDVRGINSVGADSVKVSDLWERPASPSVEARGSATTPCRRSVAAEAVPGSAIESMWAQAPNKGFLGGWSKAETLQPGTLIDRYGGETGRFFSPAGTPLDARALPAGSGSLNTYEVLSGWMSRAASPPRHSGSRDLVFSTCHRRQLPT